MNDISVKSIVVMINGAGCDVVLIVPHTITPFPIMGYDPTMKVETQAGYGVEWCRIVFGEPDLIIDMGR